MTQAEWILDALKKGPVTAMDALNGCGCFRLAPRILELRQSGHHIETETIETPSGKHVAQYHLKEKETC
jgi:hypothetical protein